MPEMPGDPDGPDESRARIEALEAMLGRTVEALDSCARSILAPCPFQVAEEARALLRANHET